MKSSFEKYGPILRRALIAAVVLPPLVALTSTGKKKAHPKSSPAPEKHDSKLPAVKLKTPAKIK